MIPPPIAKHADPPAPDKNRKVISAPMLGANAHPICHSVKRQLHMFRTICRPYNSLSGDVIKGPAAKPRTKILTASEDRMSDELWNSASM